MQSKIRPIKERTGNSRDPCALRATRRRGVATCAQCARGAPWVSFRADPASYASLGMESSGSLRAGCARTGTLVPRTRLSNKPDPAGSKPCTWPRPCSSWWRGRLGPGGLESFDSSVQPLEREVGFELQALALGLFGVPFFLPRVNVVCDFEYVGPSLWGHDRILAHVPGGSGDCLDFSAAAIAAIPSASSSSLSPCLARAASCLSIRALRTAAAVSEELAASCTFSVYVSEPVAGENPVGSSRLSVRPTSPVTTISDATTAPPRSTRNSGVESRAIPGRRGGTAEQAVTRTPARTETAAAQGRPRSTPRARPGGAARWDGNDMPSNLRRAWDGRQQQGKLNDDGRTDDYPDREPGGPRKPSIAAPARSKPVAP